jgi:hypothetical protein
VSGVNTALKAEHVYICGDTGTGKSSTIKEVIKKAPRVLVYDADKEYAGLAGFVCVTSPAELAYVLSKAPKARKKIAFVDESQEFFEFFCECAFKWSNCVVVAEEIADVTNTGKAKKQWGKLIRRGRKYGIKIIAVTQRPSEADKTILANAAVIRIYALGRHLDREAVGREVSLKADDLLMVPLEYIEYIKSDLSLTKGKLGQNSTEILRPPR